MKKILLSLVFFIPLLTQAQTGIGTTNPDPNAILDISSTTKGVLLPRLNAAQLATLAGTLTPAQTGMLVTDASTGKPYFWNGTGWKDFSTLTITAGSPLSISSTNTISINPGTAPGDLITWDGLNWVNTQPVAQHFSAIVVSNLQPSLTLNYCIALQGIFPSQNTPILSEIDLYSFTFPPKGWAECNGQLMAINVNQALFSLLGTTYGGDGQTTFALPDLRGRVPLHFGSGAGLSSYTLGQTGGIEQNSISH
ncbi:MAG TPA: tail fiber protein [Puia sp.]|nr:tail fiber protein [Puia sp.]